MIISFDLIIFFVKKIQVAFVANGATIVGNIILTKKKGDYVQKGDKVQIYLTIYVNFHFYPRSLSDSDSHVYSLGISHLVEAQSFVSLKRLDHLIYNYF